MLFALTVALAAKPVLDATLGEAVDRTSLIGLDCKRADARAPMTCLIDTRSEPMPMNVYATMADRPSGFVVTEAKARIDMPKAATRDNTLRLAREVRNGFVLAFQKIDFAITEVDVDNWIIMKKGDRTVRCTSLAVFSTTPMTASGRCELVEPAPASE